MKQVPFEDDKQERQVQQQKQQKNQYGGLSLRSRMKTKNEQQQLQKQVFRLRRRMTNGL